MTVLRDGRSLRLRPLHDVRPDRRGLLGGQRAGRAQGNTWAYLWLAPLLAIAYATAFAAERIAPFFDEWNDHDAHGDTRDQYCCTFSLRDVEHQRRAADPADLLAVPVPGSLADAVADVVTSADRVRGRRFRLHDDALPQPPLRAAVAAAFGASRRRPALRLATASFAIRCIRSST